MFLYAPTNSLQCRVLVRVMDSDGPELCYEPVRILVAISPCDEYRGVCAKHAVQALTELSAALWKQTA